MKRFNKRFSDERGQSDGLFTGAVVVIVIALLVGVFGLFTAFEKTPADKIALSYGGGLAEGNQFQKVVQPGSGITFNGFWDKWYEYPTTVRSYIVSRNEDEGDRGHSEVIGATSSDGAEIGWEVAAYFKLNTTKIRKFHENVGLKFEAWRGSGWDKMLNDTFRQYLEAAVQQESRKHSIDDYAKNPDTLADVNIGIANGLKEQYNRSLGDQYFCGPTFTGVKNDEGKVACPDFEVVVKKPNLPKSVTDAYERNKVSQTDIETAKNNAQEKVEIANGDREAKDALDGVYNDPAYVEYLRAIAQQNCAKKKGCTMIVTQGQSGVNVNTGG